MNPATALALSQILSGIIEIWRDNANKPAEWTPTPEDWDALLALNDKSAEDYKKEAAARLGIPWPPAT